MILLQGVIQGKSYLVNILGVINSAVMKRNHPETLKVVQVYTDQFLYQKKVGNEYYNLYR
jgi:hypothetical protein